MKKILLVTLLLTGLLTAQNYKQVKVYHSSSDIIHKITNLGIDHIQKNRDGSFDFFISNDLFDHFKNLGYQYEVLIDDWYKYYNEREKASSSELQIQLEKSAQVYNVTGFDYGSMGGYYTLDEVWTKLDEMKDEFPDLITAKSSIGTTHEEREIYYVKISNNPDVDEDEPEILYTALHHAREPGSMMQMIYYMYYLLENYGTDPEVTYLVDNREMYFIPVVNPDGYEYNHQTNPNGGGFWRKNRRDNGNGTFGVDLNRNYGPYEYWNSPNGGSDDVTSSDVYRGPAPFSEPETDAVRNFLGQHEFRAALNYHTFGNYLIFPYGALARETPDSLIFREFAVDMTKYNGYTYGTDMQTVNYTTRGNSDDYFYDGDLEANGKIFTMTPEVGPEFWPPQSQIIPLAEENIHPNLYLAWVIGGYVGISYLDVGKETFNPGDTVFVSVDFRNKGLEDFSGFNATLSSDSDIIQVLVGNYTGTNLDSRTTVHEVNSFSFVIDENAEQGSTADIAVNTSMDEINLSEETYSFRIGTPQVYYADDMTDFDSTWTVASNVSQKWTNTDLDFYSSPVSVTDSKYGNYRSLSNVSMQLNDPVSLAGLNKPLLTFRTHFEIEKGWDFGVCMISADSGNSWYAVPGKYTTPGTGQFQPYDEPVYSGSVSDWVEEEIDLEPFTGEDILIKFVLNSDEYVEFDGWYIDDIQIKYFGEVLTAVDGGQSLPDKFKLIQNYPNPFNPNTTIEYNIPTLGTEYYSVQQVQLKVYDVLGREVATLVNERQKPGKYSVQFDGSNLTSGLYMYRLIAEDYISVRKMLLMK